jgi:hypothetical protein
MAHMPEQQRKIYKLAVGMFGAVPGTRYFNELHGALEAGMPVNAMYSALVDSAAFQTAFGFTPAASDEQFAGTFRERLLGPDATAAGNGFAQSFMLHMLNAGLSRGEMMKAAIDALDRVESRKIRDGPRFFPDGSGC